MNVINLGKKDYLSVLGFQLRLFNEKLTGLEKGDFLIVVEHYPVYTCGKSTKEDHLKFLSSEQVIRIERGGSITFHGPGQIVIYPVLDLSKRKLSVKKYVWTLEESIIKTLHEINIEAFRIKGKRGVFTEKGKVGFVGVRISKNITMHGLSLNVNVDKSYFEKIIPCGIKDIPVSNISDLKNEVEIGDIKHRLIQNLISLL